MSAGAPGAIDARIRESFARQSIMTTLGARVETVGKGRVVIALPAGAHLGQQQGFLHAGAVTTIVDSACGYAALTLMPDGDDVLTIEFKVNLLAPARGELFLAEGRVVRAGRTITVTQGEVTAIAGTQGTTVALMTATMFRVTPKT